MKYVKKIAAIFCAVMMVVTINASVVNAASTDEGNPTVITLISGSTMSGSAAGIFAEGETDHYFKFSLGSSSSYPDVMAVYLTNPDGCNYQMEITDPQNGIIYRGIGKAGTNDKVIKIPKPRTMTTYYLHVYAADGIYNKKVYSISLDNLYVKGKYTGSFSPKKITNPGKATLDPVYSSVATIDLRRTSSIPDSVEVTEVEVSGTLSYNIGNTWMEIDNSISGSHNEARLNKGYNTSFSGLRNSYEPVKAIWSIDYYTYAGMSTTFTNPQIAISYRYDKYEEFS